MKAQAKDIAAFLINFSNEHGDTITNLKLQKLLYYTQGWYVALYNKNLFDDDFEAWVHGPVIKSIYLEYKKYGFKPIPSPKNVVDNLSKQIKDHLRELLKAYGGFSAWQLECMTHGEIPWITARGGLPDDAQCTAIISKDDIKAFFKKLAKK
jgi:uncharacterized phage-associated protein